MYFTLFRSTFLKKVHFVAKLFVPSKRNYRFKPFSGSEMDLRKILGKAPCEAVEPTFCSKETHSGSILLPEQFMLKESKLPV